MGIDTKLFIGNTSKYDDVRHHRISEIILKHLQETYGNVTLEKEYTPSLNNFRRYIFKDGNDDRILSIGQNYRDEKYAEEYPICFSLSLGCWGNSVRIMQLIAAAVIPYADKIVLIENDYNEKETIIKDNKESVEIAKGILANHGYNIELLESK